jgi:hypothetical protein
MVTLLPALAAAVSFGGSDYTPELVSRKTGVLKVTVVVEGLNAALVMPVVHVVSSHPPSVPTLGWEPCRSQRCMRGDGPVHGIPVCGVQRGQPGQRRCGGGIVRTCGPPVR